MILNEKTLPRMIDITIVQSRFTLRDVRHIAKVCKEHKFVCTYALNAQMQLLRDLLSDEPEVHIGYSVGFPSGGETTEDKLFQVREAKELRADEIDAVINVGRLKSGDYDYVQREMDAVVRAAEGTLVKGIIETMILTDEEIYKASRILMEAGAGFIKTGTGWSPKPTLPEHVSAIRDAVGDKVRIKASGGIRDIGTIQEMCRRGATRFGMSCEYALNVLDEIKQYPQGIKIDIDAMRGDTAREVLV